MSHGEYFMVDSRADIEREMSHSYARIVEQRLGDRLAKLEAGRHRRPKSRGVFRCGVRE